MKDANTRDIIAVITSTLVPNAINWYGMSSEIVQISSEDRYLQTLKSIHSLLKRGFIKIYLLDNSVKSIPFEWIDNIKSLGVIFLSMPATNTKTKNKGLTEIELLLHFCKLVRYETPILKLSGRYVLNSNKLLESDSVDIVGRLFDRRRPPEFSTKAYIVRNTLVLERILQKSEILVHTLIYRCWTPFLFLRLIKFIKETLFSKQINLFFDPPISIEEAFVHAIKELKLESEFIGELGISGVIASERVVVNE